MTDVRMCIYDSKLLPKGRRKYCCDECANSYFRERIAPYWWHNAVKIALKRVGQRCEECGGSGKLEVHHIKPLDGENRWNSKANAQDNLMVLCVKCHDKKHEGETAGKMVPKEQFVLL